jgi:hypothetical protein
MSNSFNNLTPNEQDPPKIRLYKAKSWLVDHPEEKQSTAAHIFKINLHTLSNSINRLSKTSHGSHNQRLGIDCQKAERGRKAELNSSVFYLMILVLPSSSQYS